MGFLHPALHAATALQSHFTIPAPPGLSSSQPEKKLCWGRGQKRSASPCLEQTTSQDIPATSPQHVTNFAVFSTPPSVAIAASPMADPSMYRPQEEVAETSQDPASQILVSEIRDSPVEHVDPVPTVSDIGDSSSSKVGSSPIGKVSAWLSQVSGTVYLMRLHCISH